jgi:septal ring factor EnvC (AmiA/AmiB activator)
VSRGSAASIEERIAELGDKKSDNYRQSCGREKRAEAEASQKLAAEERERRRQEDMQRRPKMVFAEARGKLDIPAQGQVVRRFGDEDGLGGRVQGVMIATRPGAQVMTPADGKVEFAGNFRSYGQVLLLNPGGGYRVLLAGMDKVIPGVESPARRRAGGRNGKWPRFGHTFR